MPAPQIILSFAKTIAYYGFIIFFIWFRYKHLDWGPRKKSSKSDIDVWKSFEHKVPNIVYGAGCKKDFSHFLKYGSNVAVNSVEDICDWLLTCQYVDDRVQFFTRDHWQHPQEFEVVKKGDCEDYALWAWNKLVKLGYQAEFMVGIVRQNGKHGAHAWVVFEENGKRMLFDCVKKSKSKMIIPVPDNATHYVPFASVDNQLQRRAYMGLLFWKRRIERSRSS